MTKKRYVKENFFDEYAIKKEDTIIAIVDSGTNARKICNELNALHEENERLQNIIEREVKKTLQKYFNRYTQMALELRHDKYGNGSCHDVIEVLMEIADDLEVKLE